MTISNRFSVSQRLITAMAGGFAIALNLWVPPSSAGDVFRTSNRRNMGANTEAAFKAIFQEGNYREAQRHLQRAESTDSNEPLTHAMLAASAYIESDWNAFRNYGNKTLQTAQQLSKTDPMRGNLYMGVGHFLEGAYTYKQQGALSAMSKLKQVFKHLDEAKRISPNDPEVNLLTGYMDLMLAVNLPLSNPSQAIQQLERHAGPKYLADRGIALGYRDLKQYPRALERANRALQQTPNNPEIHYLKAQILAGQGDRQKNTASFQQANDSFKKALSKPEQLPKGLVGQIFFEYCRNQNRLDGRQRDCGTMQNQIRNTPGTWGPVQLPRLS